MKFDTFKIQLNVQHEEYVKCHILIPSLADGVYYLINELFIYKISYL